MDFIGSHILSIDQFERIDIDEDYDGTVDKIINLPYVKTQIIKTSDKTNGELSETELENQLKTIILKSWNDSSMADNAIEKVKKDIK